LSHIGVPNHILTKPRLVFKRKHRTVVICDPISALLTLTAIDYFFCLEMYEYQVENNSVRNTLRNVFYKICLHYALLRSRNIIFPNELRANFYEKRYKITKKAIHIIKNYPSRHIKRLVSSFRPVERQYFSIFAGTINASNRGLNVFLKLARLHPERQFGICGQLARIELIKLLPDNVQYIGNLSNEEYLQVLQQTETGFLYYSNDNLNTRYCASVKLYEYLLSGCEIISNMNESILLEEELVRYWIKDNGEISLNESHNLETVHMEISHTYEMQLSTVIK
jgi:hypothetical protein